jgi:hypothetical protein
MNGSRGDDTLWLANERIHAMQADAARQRLVRQAGAPTSPSTPHPTVGAAVGWTRRVLHGRPTPATGR